MERVTFRAMDSMADWTSGSDSSVTSRHLESRPRSARVRVLEDEGLDVDEKPLMIWRICESDFRMFLNGSCWDSSSSESGSCRRRFFLPLSAIFRERERERRVARREIRETRELIWILGF